MTINQVNVIDTLSIRGGAVTLPNAKQAENGGSGTTMWFTVPDNQGEWVQTYITATTFVNPFGFGVGTLAIRVDGNPEWMGVGLEGTTITGAVVRYLRPGGHSIEVAGTPNCSGTSVFSLGCRR
ncbi:hypothetical protein D3C86_1888310 [compost metagenome]